MSEEQTLTADSNVQVVSPETVEQVMVEKALAEDPTGQPADKAAAFFKKSAQELNRLLSDMSLRECKRMIMNVAAYPFVDMRPVKKGSNEEKASYFFNEMIMHKTIMQLQYEQEKAIKAMEEEKNLNQSLIKGENTNGENTVANEKENG